MYCVNPKSAAAKYEKNFPGYVLKVCKSRVRVCVRNSKGKEIIKDVSKENIKRLEVLE